MQPTANSTLLNSISVYMFWDVRKLSIYFQHRCSSEYTFISPLSDILKIMPTKPAEQILISMLIYPSSRHYQRNISFANIGADTNDDKSFRTVCQVSSTKLNVKSIHLKLSQCPTSSFRAENRRRKKIKTLLHILKTHNSAFHQNRRPEKNVLTASKKV